MSDELANYILTFAICICLWGYSFSAFRSGSVMFLYSERTKENHPSEFYFALIFYSSIPVLGIAALIFG